ncbi:uncharacterized protein F4822DRAFT_441369 [Hypoxylon trugodes]|uniref:uncharacterized protein n=1 Tax=Hypoxylon trugodes TaxID=326681 RepID=UPI0021933F66|nr:uncharacterized protein F4822DRAFT_441369 [Hypoxylon trugodes]KAI1392358.1 hypothetical protein F4822DRAFT_441369 [Hypoxylon trugodes]
MDTRDVSVVEGYIELLDRLKQDAEKAMLRKGEIPQDHTHPFSLVSKFMTRLVAPSRIPTGEHILHTLQVPQYYHPCVLPLDQLKPLMISQMMLETHHRGTQTMVRLLTPADRVTAVMAIAEDEEGTAVLLQLYSQPDESKVSKDLILRDGDVYIIKEAFLKANIDGTYSLRIDHVSDIVWLEETDNRIPLNWRKKILDLNGNSNDFRAQGNEAIKVRDWAKAERLYTDAIRSAEGPYERFLAYLDRSFCNFQLERPEKALGDALKGSPSGIPSEKSLFRQAKALYALRKFKLCQETLLTLLRSNPKNSGAWAEIKKVRQRLNEEENGAYQFNDMYTQSEATLPLIDCATYIGPVAVRDSPSRGKGLFTTKPVKVGELLFCEKAFAYAYAGDDTPAGLANVTLLVNINNGYMTIGGQSDLIRQIIQKILHNPSEAKQVTDLHHGDYDAVTTSEADGSPVVDTFLITEIIQQNAFGCGRSSLKTKMIPMTGTRGEILGPSETHTTCGIWPLASRINHSCVPNCHRSFIGDMQIVRASEDIEADTELHFAYHIPPFNEKYEVIQKKFAHWDFVCECALCLDKKSTPRKVLKERKALFESIEPLLKRDSPMAALARVGKILEKMEKTYMAGQNGAPPQRHEMVEPSFALGASLADKDMFPAGLDMLLKGLEALGFVIAACPPRDLGDGKKKRKKGKAILEIKRWGYATELNVIAFLRMMTIYEKLAPELCNVAKEYARIAYCICAGERDTAGTCFPELA